MSRVEAGGPKVVPHFTPAERAARGKAARVKVPRTLQAEIEIPRDRDPVALLEEQAVTRVPELVPIRYGRMLSSAFAFYRGGALIMATDLSRTPNSSIRTQLCGDAHLSNFGTFGSPERDLVFDVNDFDEPGPWEWDVKRLAASFAIAGRDNGFSRKEREAAVLATARSYRKAMTGFAAMRAGTARPGRVREGLRLDARFGVVAQVRRCSSGSWARASTRCPACPGSRGPGLGSRSQSGCGAPPWETA
jgi:hypothetical protein